MPSDPRFTCVRDGRLVETLGGTPVPFDKDGKPATLTPQRPTLLIRVLSPRGPTWWYWDIDQKIIDEGVGG